MTRGAQGSGGCKLVAAVLAIIEEDRGAALPFSTGPRCKSRLHMGFAPADFACAMTAAHQQVLAGHSGQFLNLFHVLAPEHMPALLCFQIRYGLAPLGVDYFSTGIMGIFASALKR